MVEQLFDGFRKASESSLQMQQEMLKHWTQQWTTVGPTAANTSGDAASAAHKRWVALGLELLDKHRVSLDATYAAGIELIEQTFRTSEAKSAEEYRRMTEELWRKLFEAYQRQSETQWSNFQQWSTKSAEVARDARP